VPHVLNIGHSFIQNIDNKKDNRSIVGATINMSKNRGQRAIAEGIATGMQRDLVLNVYCEADQGALFSQLVSADEFVALLGEA
jgi:EAL domain-containing protein (putative c-di-GMP-specific phosphodiesterase class I)